MLGSFNTSNAKNHQIKIVITMEILHHKKKKNDTEHESRAWGVRENENQWEGSKMH